MRQWWSDHTVQEVIIVHLVNQLTFPDSGMTTETNCIEFEMSWRSPDYTVKETVPQFQKSTHLLSCIQLGALHLHFKHLAGIQTYRTSSSLIKFCLKISELKRVIFVLTFLDLNFQLFTIGQAQHNLIFMHRLQWSVCVREREAVLQIMCVPAWPVTQLSQQTKGSVSRNIHLWFHPETQHGLLLQGVKKHLGIKNYVKKCGASGEIGKALSSVKTTTKKLSIKEIKADTLSFSELRRQLFLAANIFRAETLL